MSWSVNRVGMPAAVAARVAEDIARPQTGQAGQPLPDPEPEATVKKLVAELVAKALAAYPPKHAVRIDVGGSQHCPDFSKTPNEAVTFLALKIQGIPGFLAE